MTSRRPYCCSKTIKRRPCWCPKPVLWELNSFLMQTLSFVPINLHRCWPREWKHSIVKQYNSVFYWKWSKVQESILRQQIIHGLSSVRKSAGLKSSMITFLTHFHAVELDRNSKKAILSNTSKKASKKKLRISLLVTNNNSSSSQLPRFLCLHCWLDSLKKYWFFSLKT